MPVRVAVRRLPLRSSGALLVLLAACSSTDPGSDPGDAGVAVDTGSALDATMPDMDGAMATDASADAFDASVKDATPIDAGPASKRQVPRPLGSTASANGYYEYLPPGYDGTEAAPLLVFWHGLDEDGNGTTDLSKVLVNGPPKLIANDTWPNTRPFIVLSPQNASNCPTSAIIDAFLTFAKTKYNVDAKRIYLTGLSCGAIGSWAYLTEHKGTTVAASLVISGDPANAYAADGCGLVANVALWSVHGDMDPRVAYQPDHDTMINLLACPSPPRQDVKWTPVAGGQHDVWTKTYDLSGGYGDVYAWMLAHPKP